MKLKERRFSIPFCIFDDDLPDKALLLLTFLFSQSDCAGAATLGYREIMAGTGIESRNTVAKCLKIIREHGWFDYVRKRGSRPSTFYLRVPERHERHAPRRNIVYLKWKTKKSKLGIHIE